METLRLLLLTNLSMLIYNWHILIVDEIIFNVLKWLLMLTILYTPIIHWRILVCFHHLFYLLTSTKLLMVMYDWHRQIVDGFNIAIDMVMYMLIIY